MERNCAICGKTFELKVRNQIYCSDECKKEAARRKQAEYAANFHIETEKVCSVCGKKFTTSRSYQVYCSRQCFSKRNEKRRYEKQSLNENIRKADECGLSYGKYVALVSSGKTYEEILQMRRRNAI